MSISCAAGAMVGLVGPNGAGKSTALGVLSGSLSPWRGRVLLDGNDITREPPHWRACQGIGFLMSGGQVFPSMTVTENLQLARLLAAQRSCRAPRPVDPLAIFPELQDRLNLRAGLLSGGERQMLAIAAVLIQSPRVLLLDSPPKGWPFRGRCRCWSESPSTSLRPKPRLL